MNYQIKIKALNGYDEKIKKVFSYDRFSRTVRIKEIICDEIYYILLVTCNYKQPALRSELKKYFKQSSGKKHLSIKKWDGNLNSVLYLFKNGKPHLDMLKGFMDYQFEKIHENIEIIASVSKKFGPFCNMIKRAIMYFTENKIHEPSDKEIYKYIMCFIKNSDDPFPNKTEMENLIVRIQGSVRDRDSWEKYIDTAFQKLNF
jgi:hypothetical protein